MSENMEKREAWRLTTEIKRKNPRRLTACRAPRAKIVFNRIK